MSEILQIHDHCGRAPGRRAGSVSVQTLDLVLTPSDLPVREQWSTEIPSRASEMLQAQVQAPRRSRLTMWIACAGALAYNSWPLAFLVNPSLAGSALASSFEGRSEPFSWLFILLDCVAGLCIAVVCVRELRPRRDFRGPRTMLAFALLGYGVFGMSTALDAVVPLNCGSNSAQECASQVWPLTPDDLLTGIAVLALFAATVAVVFLMTREPAAFPSSVPVTLGITLIGWSLLGLAVLLSTTSAVLAATFQYSFLTLTSILMFIVPLGAVAAHRRSTVL
jgi:hypothetical protein